VPSKNPIQRLEDILENIALIQEFSAGMDVRSFTHDRKTSNTVERCLERISEAARKLGADAERLCPAVPWPQLRAVGNLLRHEYDSVDGARVWLMIETDLMPLKNAVQAALNRMGGVYL
jgi:uncharacterized protein with HEPN domain